MITLGRWTCDFNNLLMSMLGNAELLADRTRDPASSELCSGIVAAALRARDLTSQLLTCAGRRELEQRKPVDLSAL